MITIRIGSALAIFSVSTLVLFGGCGGEDWDEARQSYALSSAVEKWRPLVEKYLKRQHVTWGMNIIKCESGGNPNAYNSSSGASGLFQHLKRYWPARASAAGFAGASPFNPEANIAASAYLLYTKGGGPGHWSCKFSPYENFGYKPQFYDNGKPVGSTPTTPSCKALGSSGGIIDNAGQCFELYGPTTYWRAVSGQGHNGDLLWTNATQKSTASNWARWQVVIGTAGRYKVKYYSVAAYAMFRNTRYEIRHAGKTAKLNVDQSVGGTGWKILGTFNFAKGAGQHVSIYDNSVSSVAKDQHIVADAIKLERVVDPPPSNPPPSNPPPSEPPPSNPPPSNPPPSEPPPSEPPPSEPPGEQPTPNEPPVSPPNPNPVNPGTQVVGGCNVGSTSSPVVPVALLLPLMLLLVARRRQG